MLQNENWKCVNPWLVPSSQPLSTNFSWWHANHAWPEKIMYLMVHIVLLYNWHGLAHRAECPINLKNVWIECLLYILAEDLSAGLKVARAVTWPPGPSQWQWQFAIMTHDNYVTSKLTRLPLTWSWPGQVLKGLAWVIWASNKSSSLACAIAVAVGLLLARQNGLEHANSCGNFRVLILCCCIDWRLLLDLVCFACSKRDLCSAMLCIKQRALNRTLAGVSVSSWQKKKKKFKFFRTSDS